MPKVKQPRTSLFPSPTPGRCSSSKSSNSDLWSDQCMNTSNEISNTHTVFPFVLFFSLGYCLKYAALLCMGNNYVSDVNVESLVVYRGFQLHHGGKSLTVKCCCYFNFPFFAKVLLCLDMVQKLVGAHKATSYNMCVL